MHNTISDFRNCINKSVFSVSDLLFNVNSLLCFTIFILILNLSSRLQFDKQLREALSLQSTSNRAKEDKVIC